MKKLTSERLGREGLAAWGATRPQGDPELPDIEEETSQGEITFIVSPPPVTPDEKSQNDDKKIDQEDEEPPHQQGFFFFSFYIFLLLTQ